MSITVNVPTDVESRLRHDVPDLERRILEGFAVEEFRRGEMSSGQVGEVLGMESRWQAIDFLSARGVYPGYDVEDFEQDIENLAKLKERQYG